MSSINYISSRTLKITFNGNPKTTIIVTYVPTNVADEEDVIEHFKQLNDATKAVPAHNFLVVTGDFNARIGQDDSKFTYHESINRNGNIMCEFALENNLIITNTTFQKKKSKLWTCELPSGYRAQLDYILVRQKWRTSVINVQAYNSFSSIGSGHRIVTANIRLSLRANSKQLPKKVSMTGVNLQAVLTYKTNIPLRLKTDTICCLKTVMVI